MNDLLKDKSDETHRNRFLSCKWRDYRSRIYLTLLTVFITAPSANWAWNRHRLHSISRLDRL